MNGILVVNKEKDMTSRDVVNIASKSLGTKKVGHTGTLDPLAEGILVLTIGKYTRLGELLTSLDKEYVVTVELGKHTDSFDITGNILEEKRDFVVTKEQIERSLKYYQKTYLQEVPIYSAVKVNGKKLYEYARNNETVELPKKEVTIFDIELLDYDNKSFCFRTKVSKGTYIRSLIRDVAELLDIPCTMSGLQRTKQGIFDLKYHINTIEDLKEQKFKFYDIKEILKDSIVEIKNKDLLKKIMNGVSLDIEENTKDFISFFYQNNLVAIYKKQGHKLKADKVLISDINMLE